MNDAPPDREDLILKAVDLGIAEIEDLEKMNTMKLIAAIKEAEAVKEKEEKKDAPLKRIVEPENKRVKSSPNKRRKK